jgi:WhiB family redox-sensing transcriptional regulator
MNDPMWRADALCAQVDGDLFFRPPNSNADWANQAKRICAECPVIYECLRYAINTNQEHGVWGGLTPHERRKLGKRITA